MGHLHDNYGRITIEGRRESFTIHASYGYSVGKRAVESLDFSTPFIHDSRVRRVRAKYEDHVEAIDEQFSTVTTIRNGTLVAVPDTEDFDLDAPLARRWSEFPHPEFDLDDLDDLIAALTAFKESR